MSRADAGQNIVMRHYNIRGNGMDFSRALEEIKRGCCVGRQGWNGRGMYLFLNDRSSDATSEFERGGVIFLEAVELPWIAMKTVQGDVVPWLCSQTDMLATDWETVET